MLLLVLQPELDDLREFRRPRRPRQQRADRRRRRARDTRCTSSSEGRDSRPRSGARMPLADRVVIRVEEGPERGVERPVAAQDGAASTKVSKNQVVCARCHLTGLASGIDCSAQSSADNGAASAVRRRANGGETSLQALGCHVHGARARRRAKRSSRRSSRLHAGRMRHRTLDLGGTGGDAPISAALAKPSARKSATPRRRRRVRRRRGVRPKSADRSAARVPRRSRRRAA